MVVDEDSWYPVTQLCVAMVPSSMGGGVWTVADHSIGEGEDRTDGCEGLTINTVSTNAHTTLTSTDRIISSAPSSGSTRPHHQSSHLVASGTGVGSRGVHSSGGSGVTVHKWCSIGWYSEVWTSHCNKHNTHTIMLPSLSTLNGLTFTSWISPTPHYTSLTSPGHISTH